MTTPSPQVNQAKLGVGFDCDSKIGEDAAVEFFQAGFQFACRYVPLWDSSGAGDIDQDEALIILNSGMDLRLVQHAHMPGWAPSRQLGALDGQAAVIAAQKAGYLPGATLWCDCEGVSGSAGSEDLTSYLTAWASAALAAGFKAGLYIGADVPLSPMQLYKLYGFDQYWSGANVKLSVATRGYSTIQLWPPVTLAGLELDIDITTPDMLGGLPFELSSWPT
jgi:hypothetical protein